MEIVKKWAKYGLHTLVFLLNCLQDSEKKSAKILFKKYEDSGATVSFEQWRQGLIDEEK